MVQEVVVVATKNKHSSKLNSLSKKNQNSVLSRLSCVAMLLPGICNEVGAARIEEKVQTDFQMATYKESDERMQVDVFEAAISAPLGEQMDVHLDVIKDVMAGASPQFNIPGVDGKAEQILSGASIREERDVVNLGFNYYWDDLSLGLSSGLSNENDYLSRYVKTQLNWDLNKKMTTLTASVTTSFDEIEPTKEDYQEDKRTWQYFLGMSQIIDEHALFSSNISYSTNRGFLSDPYKKVFFTRAGLRLDNRPGSRYQWAWLNRYVRTFKQLNKAALHLDYRFYHDNWGVEAHTFEINWHQPIGQGWELVPRLRYYSQTAADFYQPFFTSPDGLSAYSSDYRLADFGAISGGINLVNHYQQSGSISGIKVRVGFEYYDRRAAYQWSAKDSDDFADYHSLMISAGLRFEF